jgi:uncharacterized DUF497 family protein
MSRRIDGFDWDEGNRRKCQKHGVAIVDIEALLSANPRIAPDAKHSASENRYIAVGRNSRGRPMFVAFAVRIKEGQWLVRPVTALHA